MTSSYVRLLADRRLRGLAAGDVISSIGDGMAVVAGPWLALQLGAGGGCERWCRTRSTRTSSSR